MDNSKEVNMTADELKQFCKERNLTYKELAEKIGVSEGGLKNAIIADKITAQVERSVEMIKRIEILEAKLQKAESIRQIFKEWTQEP